MSANVLTQLHSKLSMSVHYKSFLALTWVSGKSRNPINSLLEIREDQVVTSSLIALIFPPYEVGQSTGIWIDNIEAVHQVQHRLTSHWQ